MLVTIVLAALAVDGLFSLAGIIPDGPRPTRADIFGTISIDYKLFLNVAATAIFALLVWLSRGGGASHACEDPSGYSGYSDREHSSA